MALFLFKEKKVFKNKITLLASQAIPHPLEGRARLEVTLRVNKQNVSAEQAVLDPQAI